MVSALGLYLQTGQQTALMVIFQAFPPFKSIYTRKVLHIGSSSVKDKQPLSLKGLQKVPLIAFRSPSNCLVDFVAFKNGFYILVLISEKHVASDAPVISLQLFLTAWYPG